VKEVKSEVGLFIEVEEATVRVVERSLSEAVALDEGSILKIEDIQLEKTVVNVPKVRRKAGRGRSKRGQRGMWIRRRMRTRTSPSPRKSLRL